MPPATVPGRIQDRPTGISDRMESKEASRASKPLWNARKRSLALEMREEEDEDEEDELAIGVPVRQMKKARVAAPSTVARRAAAVRIVNGVMTPVTDTESASPWSRNSADTDMRRLALHQQAGPALSSGSDEESIAAPLRRRRSWHEVTDAEAAQAKVKALLVSSVGPAYPRWMYQGWQAPAPILPEHSAVTALQSAYGRMYQTPDPRPEWTYFHLDDFCIYQSANSSWHAGELVTLEKLTQPRKAQFCLSGVVSVGDTKYFLKDVPFNVLTLEYGDTRSWQDRVCVQSSTAAQQHVYYKLGKPATEYARFYRPFLSIAQFTDYFIDYMCAKDGITIADFKCDFWSWLQLNYGEDSSFKAWHRSIRMQDFRSLIAVNVEFLWKESWDIDQQSSGTSDATRLCKHPIWTEIHPERLYAIPAQRVNYHAKTVVTPFANRCFQTMYFSDMLKVHFIKDESLRARVAVCKRNLALTPLRCVESGVKVKTLDGPISPLTRVTDVSVGDVIVVEADRRGHWRLSTTLHWYAYIQRIWTTRTGRRRLDVIWLYQPSDTTIGNAFYPYSNELFLSDNCGCGKDALYLDSVNNILGKVEVDWHRDDPSAEEGFFVRRTFRTVPELDQFDFVQLQQQHFCCQHQDAYQLVRPDYHIGDTVLMMTEEDASGRNCRPAMVVDLDEEYVQLKKLSFASETQPSARLNELVFADEETVLRHQDAIVRRCYVRIFDRDEISAGRLPTPYDRNGAFDYFYIAQDQRSSGSSHDLFNILNQAWDPGAPHPRAKLTGLGLFCGGGTFDRGLAEGGAVRFRYAVDLASKALHSYRANDPRPEQTQYYLGSVNEYLAAALASSTNQLIAKPGEVHIISAGFPCQGFSNMNNNKQSEHSLRNASMVASVVSYVDLYAPRQLFLENVVPMTRNLPNGDNVFSQMIASLVGLGYQVQQFLMDADRYGSCQARPRVFIVATAPNCVALEQPEYSHARSAQLMKQRHLGRCSNGKPFGSRRANAFVSFAPCTAEDAVDDLPDIEDGQTFLTPSHPEHTPAREETATTRNRIALVPKLPHGMTLVRAVQTGLVRGEPLVFCSGPNQIKVGPGSKAYCRVFPRQPFGTIITRLTVGDGINGQVVHWKQDRVLTILEARRAQGYPDHEVLVGLPADRLKIVGNSVDRKVALVLGLALRESWLKSPPVAHHDPFTESMLGMPSAGLTTVPDLAESDRSEISAMNRVPAVDNRSVKMSLNLSQEEIAGIRVGGFKRIKEVLGRPEHRAARQSLHSGP